MEAITGRRVFYAGEYRRMIVAENIVIAFRERASTNNVVEWMRENRELADLLFEAEQLGQMLLKQVEKNADS